MGWQQYSRPLWLSRGNPYILYLKAITVQMPTLRLFFHRDSLPGSAPALDSGSRRGFLVELLPTRDWVEFKYGT